MIDAVAVIAAIGTLLSGITAAGVARKWVFGWVYDEKAQEADFWRDAFLESVRKTDQAIGVAEKAAIHG